MKKEISWNTPLSIEQCRAVFLAHMEEVTRFQFVSKLSSGGVVRRVLAVPETELPFWGKEIPQGIKMAQTLPSINISPYQPIVRVEFIQETGTNILLSLEPHPQASMFAVVEGIGAVLCITAG